MSDKLTSAITDFLLYLNDIEELINEIIDQIFWEDFMEDTAYLADA